MAPKSTTTHPDQDAFPTGMSGPSLRALDRAGIQSMADVKQWTEADLAELHGMGPKALGILKAALEAKGQGFRR